jgi:hypothetical protein
MMTDIFEPRGYFSQPIQVVINPGHTHPGYIQSSAIPFIREKQS